MRLLLAGLAAFADNCRAPANGSEFVGIARSVANRPGGGDRLDLAYQDATESLSGGWGSIAGNRPLSRPIGAVMAMLFGFGAVRAPRSKLSVAFTPWSGVARGGSGVSL